MNRYNDPNKSRTIFLNITANLTIDISVKIYLNTTYNYST